jgi:hypothetical protein
LDRKALVYIYGTTEIIRAVEIARAAEITRAAEIVRVGVIKIFIFATI